MQESEFQDKRVEVVVRTFCNKCGNLIDPGDLSGIESHSARIFATWGYGSPKDGEDHSLDLCEVCYDVFVHECRIPPTVTGLKGLV
jgi:hypothetical protein